MSEQEYDDDDTVVSMPALRFGPGGLILPHEPDPEPEPEPEIGLEPQIGAGVAVGLDGLPLSTQDIAAQASAERLEKAISAVMDARNLGTPAVAPAPPEEEPLELAFQPTHGPPRTRAKPAAAPAAPAPVEEEEVLELAFEPGRSPHLGGESPPPPAAARVVARADRAPAKPTAREPRPAASDPRSADHEPRPADREPRPAVREPRRRRRRSGPSLAKRVWDRVEGVANRHLKPLAAVAFVLLAWLLWPASSANIPTYALEGPFGGLPQEQVGASVPQQYKRTSELRVVLRPEFTPKSLPQARFIISGPGGTREAPPLAVAVDERGVIRLEARAKALFKRYGRHTIHAVIAADEVENVGQIAPDALQVQVEEADGQYFQTKVEYVR